MTGSETRIVCFSVLTDVSLILKLKCSSKLINLSKSLRMSFDYTQVFQKLLFNHMKTENCISKEFFNRT